MINYHDKNYVCLALFQMTFEDSDSHDMFWVDLNDWVAIDQKLDGWKEFPVPWPAVHISSGE